MVISVGVDVVDIARMTRALVRTPALRERLFGEGDLSDVVSPGGEESSLAARFAAKEAVLKALGGNMAGFSWHDIQVRRPRNKPPVVELRGTVLERATSMGIDTWHISLSHDGGIATAFVVAESRGREAHG